MPSFAKTNTLRGPFGKNQYMRSTQDLKFESYTLAAAKVPVETVDGNAAYKLCQSGELIAKVTSGTSVGAVAPYRATNGTEGVQTIANAVGFLETFCPWELNERDMEVSVCYEGTLVQAWCFERDATTGLRVPLTNTTRDALLALPQCKFIFK
jgi:hypothetical protein